MIIHPDLFTIYLLYEEEYSYMTTKKKDQVCITVCTKNRGAGVCTITGVSP
jgi:translation initiation factor 1 (eIF-1/SUI1)